MGGRNTVSDRKTTLHGEGDTDYRWREDAFCGYLGEEYSK